MPNKQLESWLSSVRTRCERATKGAVFKPCLKGLHAECAIVNVFTSDERCSCFCHFAAQAMTDLPLLLSLAELAVRADVLLDHDHSKADKECSYCRWSADFKAVAEALPVPGSGATPC